MRGIKLKHEALGKLMKRGRERQQLSLAEAALMLGLVNRQHLWRCENAVSNFSADTVRRAIDLYRIPVSTAVEASTKDFSGELGRYLRAR